MSAAYRIRTRVARPWLAAALSLLAAEVAAQPRRAPAPSRNNGRSAPRACVPGAQTPCACVGGSRGAQVCNDAGNALGPCRCASEAPVSAPSARSHPTETRPASSFDPIAVRGGRRWYGWQTLLADIGGISLSAVGFATGSDALYWGGGAVQLIGGPIAHWSHGRVGTGFVDLGLRLVLPLTLGLVAWAPERDATALLIGASVGQVLAIVLDASVLAYEERGPAQSASGSASRLVWGFSPSQQGAYLSVGGTM